MVQTEVQKLKCHLEDRMRILHRQRCHQHIFHGGFETPASARLHGWSFSGEPWQPTWFTWQCNEKKNIYIYIYHITYVKYYTYIYIYIVSIYIYILYLYIYIYMYIYIYILYVYIYIYIYCRRKFRSQTSDNMDRWKAEQGRGREKRKIRREKIRRERVRRQKIQMREKVGKSRNTVFFQWFVAPEGRKVGSLKRRVRSQLATGAMKNCTPLWREAHFQVKMYKTPQHRTTFRSCDVEKVHAVVARSTFPSQNVQNTPFSDHFWKLRCRKSARRCGAKHISKSKCTKH